MRPLRRPILSPENSSTWRGTAISVDLRGQEESYEQYGNKDVFEGVDCRRDRQREEGPSPVSDNREEEDRRHDRQDRSESASPEEKGECRYVQRETCKNRTDRYVANGLQIGCWPGLKAEWSQENNEQDVHDQRKGKRHDVSGEFHP